MKSCVAGKRMKGQLVFEFVVATLLFLAIVMYTINLINVTALQYSQGNSVEIVENRAWEISEMLLRSEGVWGATPPVAIGIAEKWPVLSEQKIADLGGNCTTGLQDVMRKLNVNPTFNGMSIDVYRFLPGQNPIESLVMACGSKPTDYRSSEITRYGISDIDSSMLKVKVFYW